MLLNAELSVIESAREHVVEHGAAV